MLLPEPQMDSFKLDRPLHPYVKKKWKTFGLFSLVITLLQNLRFCIQLNVLDGHDGHTLGARADNAQISFSLTGVRTTSCTLKEQISLEMLDGLRTFPAAWWLLSRNAAHHSSTQSSAMFQAPSHHWRTPTPPTTSFGGELVKLTRSFITSCTLYALCSLRNLRFCIQLNVLDGHDGHTLGARADNAQISFSLTGVRTTSCTLKEQISLEMLDGLRTFPAAWWLLSRNAAHHSSTQSSAMFQAPSHHWRTPTPPTTSFGGELVKLTRSFITSCTLYALCSLRNLRFCIQLNVLDGHDGHTLGARADNAQISFSLTGVRTTSCTLKEQISLEMLDGLRTFPAAWWLLSRNAAHHSSTQSSAMFQAPSHHWRTPTPPTTSFGGELVKLTRSFITSCTLYALCSLRNLRFCIQLNVLDGHDGHTLGARADNAQISFSLTGVRTTSCTLKEQISLEMLDGLRTFPAAWWLLSRNAAHHSSTQSSAMFQAPSHHWRTPTPPTTSFGGELVKLTRSFITSCTLYALCSLRVSQHASTQMPNANLP
ncbi:hypothetical protein Aperf_G00000049196 [Anoplocephala perfoliata]